LPHGSREAAKDGSVNKLPCIQLNCQDPACDREHADDPMPVCDWCGNDAESLDELEYSGDSMKICGACHGKR
jgi:hypothetical protein